jgi:hypothetical protein
VTTTGPSRPGLLITYHMLSAGDRSIQQLQEALQGGHSVSVELPDPRERPGQAARAMVGALGDIAEANPDVQVKVLDHTALKVCIAC